MTDAVFPIDFPPTFGGEVYLEVLDGETRTIPSGTQAWGHPVNVEGTLNVGGTLNITTGMELESDAEGQSSGVAITSLEHSITASGSGEGIGEAIISYGSSLVATGTGSGVGSATIYHERELHASGEGEGEGEAVVSLFIPILRVNDFTLYWQVDEFTLMVD